MTLQNKALEKKGEGDSQVLQQLGGWYPLVKKNIAIENCDFVRGFTH